MIGDRCTLTTRPLVLAIDDIAANLDVLVAHLGGESLQLMVALSGEDGLTLAREHLPDLILLDIMMPGMDGYEVCRQLKANTATRDIPVIFVSAMDDDINMETGLNLGAIDYISKPFSLPVLKARLRNHLALKQKNDELAKQAFSDELTGLVNRRHFNTLFHQEWHRGRRNKSPLSLIMIDVDHFKNFNDHYGHPQGDRCLQSVATVLRNGLRQPIDVAARFGGEEFMVLLPDTAADGALEVAERLRTQLLALEIPHCRSATHHCVTISLGVFTCIPHPQFDEQVLLQAVDQQLYKAKQQGRNQVCQRSQSLEE
jgi:diguanylate cyclase (GGDEF)-like protein